MKPTPEQIEQFRLAREKKRSERRCPSCSNIMTQDGNFPRIYKCKVPDCKIDSVIVTVRSDPNVRDVRHYMLNTRTKSICISTIGVGQCSRCGKSLPCEICRMKIKKEHDYTCSKCLSDGVLWYQKVT